jgi:yecA family protein
MVNGATMMRLFESPIAMTSATPIDFTQLSDLLQNFGALLSAAEVHGFLVGQLAAGKRFSRSEWLRAANEQADLSQSPDEVTGDRLHALYQTTLTALENGELSFQLLLPDDENPLPERVENLGLWCQGFLTGFGLAGSKLKIDSELAEALHDISAIAQIGASEDEAAQESSENDLFSIGEYVRLTVAEIFWDNNTARASAPKVEPSAASPADLFKRKKLH